MIRALLFDFDGLILDTEGPIFRCWQEIYREKGAFLPLSAWAAGIGSPDGFDPYAYLEAQIGRAVDRAALEAQSLQRAVALIQAQAVLPGVKEYVAEAQRLGLKLGVASSSSREWVTGHLSRLGLLAAFEAIKCSDDVQRAKPDPELYSTLLAVLGLKDSEAVALEDSPNGIRAAKGAGIFCVAVPNPLTRQLSLDHADLQLASLADMPLGRLLTTVEAVQRNSEGGRRAGLR